MAYLLLQGVSQIIAVVGHVGADERVGEHRLKEYLCDELLGTSSTAQSSVSAWR
jgi:hypothetical protein